MNTRLRLFFGIALIVNMVLVVKIYFSPTDKTEEIEQTHIHQKLNALKTYATMQLDRRLNDHQQREDLLRQTMAIFGRSATVNFLERLQRHPLLEAQELNPNLEGNNTTPAITTPDLNKKTDLFKKYLAQHCLKSFAPLSNENIDVHISHADQLIYQSIAKHRNNKNNIVFKSEILIPKNNANHTVSTTTLGLTLRLPSPPLPQINTNSNVPEAQLFKGENVVYGLYWRKKNSGQLQGAFKEQGTDRWLKDIYSATEIWPSTLKHQKLHQQPAQQRHQPEQILHLLLTPLTHHKQEALLVAAWQRSTALSTIEQHPWISAVLLLNILALLALLIQSNVHHSSPSPLPANSPSPSPPPVQNTSRDQQSNNKATGTLFPPTKNPTAPPPPVPPPSSSQPNNTKNNRQRNEQNSNADIAREAFKVWSEKKIDPLHSASSGALKDLIKKIRAQK